MIEILSTKTNRKSPSELSARQLNAIEMLAMGQKVTDVATTLGINRHQIWKWQQNPYFVAAVNHERAELWGNAKQRLRGLLDRSVNALEQAVDEGDVKASIEVIKILGLYGQVGMAQEPQTGDEVMIQEAKSFVKELLAEPSDDPVAYMSFVQNMKPKLIFEKFHELKQELEDYYVGEDNDETTSTESATGIE